MTADTNKPKDIITQRTWTTTTTTTTAV